MRGQNNKTSEDRKFPQKLHLKGKTPIGTKNNNKKIDDSTIVIPKSKDGSTAQDTIYLCNFRVSVDGEWLCLKELQDGMQSNEGAPPVEETKSIHVAKDKCREKIVEQDWVNYYCRCFFLNLVSKVPYSIQFQKYNSHSPHTLFLPSQLKIDNFTHYVTQTHTQTSYNSINQHFHINL